jgi:Fe2+ or Zn2+ uptake regulation protein
VGRPLPAVVPGSLPRDASRFPLLLEPPHAHVVCRVCGRIASVPLDTDGSLLLERLARQRPDGWTVDLISFSLTGACERCRQKTDPDR